MFIQLYSPKSTFSPHLPQIHLIKLFIIVNIVLSVERIYHLTQQTMKKLSVAILGILLSSQISFSQDCTQPTITATTGQGTYCLGEEVTLTITGELNDATEWQWSTGDCGEQIIENATTTSITVTVEDTISYFVRGIGGCVANTATCTEIEVYLDNAPPEVNCPGDIVASNDEGICGAVVSYDIPEATDHCDEEVTIEQTEGLGSGATFPVGVTTETFLITDSQGNETTCSFTVTVEDTEAPVLNCHGDIDVENDPGECGAIVTYDMPTATDNCEVMELAQTAGLGSGAMFPVGTTIETFVAKDAAGNESTCSISVTVRDTEPPVITLSQNLDTKWPPNHKAFEIMIDDYIESVTDNCPGVSIEDVIIDEVSSDEPQNENGDGNTDSDITMGEDCKTVYLLAERQGGGNGRVYKVELAVMDAHGNIGYETIMAEISHDQSKKKSVVDDGPAYVVNGCDIELPEEMADNENTDEAVSDESSEASDEMSVVIEEGSVETNPNPYQNSFSVNFKPSVNDRISVELFNTAGVKIKRVYEGSVEQSKMYEWSVELGNIKDKILLLVIQGKKNYTFKKVVRM